MILSPRQPIPHGRPYRYHLNGPVHMMTTRKRVGPLPTHRLAVRHSIDHSSSDSSSEASSDFHSDASSDPSSRHPLSDPFFTRFTEREAVEATYEDTGRFGSRGSMIDTQAILANVYRILERVQESRTEACARKHMATSLEILEVEVEDHSTSRLKLKIAWLITAGYIRDEIQVDDKLNFIEEPVEIMDREVKRLKQIRIPNCQSALNSREVLRPNAEKNTRTFSPTLHPPQRLRPKL
ncbi:hypothetical protein Tco_0077535 [Tanacetum coccineum]